MINKLILSILMLNAVSHVQASIIFDVNFESPLYSNGQSITGGSEPNEPSGAVGGSLNTVSDSILGFSSQAALFSSGGQMNFDPIAGPFNSGIHLITWDMGAPVWPSQGVVTFDGTSQVLFSVSFQPSNAQHPSDPVIEYGLGLNRPSIVNTTGTANSFQMIFDLDNDMVDFWINGSLLEDNYSISSGASLDLVSFSQNVVPGYQYGMDNFRWEIVPEPSAILLMLSGLSMLAMHRRRKLE